MDVLLKGFLSWVKALIKISTIQYVFHSSNLKDIYEFVTKQMLLKRIVKQCALLFFLVPLSVGAQNITVRGTVMDELGEGLPGVTISVVKSSKGVTTDIDGKYSMEVMANAQLVFSFVGMKTQTIDVLNRTIINLVMIESSEMLDEVQIVAFGTQRKESVIGAITTVKVSDLKAPVGKISTSLAGKMAGVVAVQRSGEPGQSSEFWIRGMSTFGANTRPLVLVDGIERSMDLVDAEDIETFSILKDATATALYGVRGANGVILINTRRGVEGKPVVTTTAEFGVSSPTKMPKMVNAEQYIDLFNEVYEEQYPGQIYFSSEVKDKYISGVDPDLYPNVNWMKEIYKDNSTNFRGSVNITGGSKMLRYYVAGSAYRENGIFNAISGNEYNPSVNYTRYNFRSNVDLDLTESTTVRLSLSTQYEDKRKPDTDALWATTMQISPIAIPKMFSDGTLAAPDASVRNPYNLLNNTGYVQQFNNNAQSLIGISQDFSKILTPGLKAEVKLSWDAVHGSTISRHKNPSTYWANGRDEDGNLVLVKNYDGTDYLTLWHGNSGHRKIYLEASSTYDRVFDKHRVGGLFMYYMSDQSDEFPGSYIFSLPYRSMGIAGRFTYSYRDAYFIEGNFGYNGSENFAPGHKFGFFPSGAIGYVVSNEEYFKPLLNVVSLLKLKASYGEVGNDKIGSAGSQRRFAYNTEMQGTSGYVFGDQRQKSLGGMSTGYPGNPNVEWESAKKANFGIELELFNSLKIQADYFNEKRRGIFILRQSVPSIYGVNVSPYVNLGQMDNKGVDMSLEYFKKIGEVNIGIRGNLTYNRNRKLYDDAPSPIQKYQDPIGKPYNQQFGLVFLGYFEDDEDIKSSPKQDFGTVRPGDRKYLDVNGDGVVNSYDRIAIGRTSIPELNYGTGVSLSWQGFDVSVFFSGIGGVTGFMDGPPINGFESDKYYASNFYQDVVENRWTIENPNPNAIYPRLSLTNNENNKQLSTAKQYDASFVRLKDAEIGYTLPKSISNRMFMSSCRFYLQGHNLLTFSNFKLWDPEVHHSYGSQYPNMKPP